MEKYYIVHMHLLSTQLWSYLFFQLIDSLFSFSQFFLQWIISLLKCGQICAGLFQLFSDVLQLWLVLLWDVPQPV